MSYQKTADIWQSYATRVFCRVMEFLEQGIHTSRFHFRFPQYCTLRKHGVELVRPPTQCRATGLQQTLLVLLIIIY